MFAKIVGRRTTALATTLAVVVGLAITPAFTATAAEGGQPVIIEAPAAELVEAPPAESSPPADEAPAPVVEEAPAPLVEEAPAPLAEEAPAPLAEPVEAPPVGQGDFEAQSPIAPMGARISGPAAEPEPAGTNSMVAPMAHWSIQPSWIAPFVVDQPIDIQFSYPDANRWGYSGLPSGLNLNTVSGKLTGKMKSTGTYSFEVVAYFRSFFGSYWELSRATYTVRVGEAAPVITSNSLDGATVGSKYDQQLAASGAGPLSYRVSQGALPAGLSLSSTGRISGTPTFTAGYDGSDRVDFSVIANNGSDSAAKQLSITVTTPKPEFGSAALATATVGAPYNQVLPLTTGYGTLTYALDSGNLPRGLTLGSNGIITGTPEYAATYSPTQVFTFNARVNGPTGSDNQSFTLTLNVTGPTITTPTLPEAWLTENYTQAIATTGPGVMLGATGLPAGLGLVGTSDTGYSITGIPEIDGEFPVVLTASNVGGTATATLSLTVNAAPVFVTTSPLRNAVVGAPYSTTVEAAGTDVTYTLVSGPAGIVVDAVTGELSGWTPTDEANVYVRVEAKNRSGSVERGFTVRPFAVPTITTTVLDAGKVGNSYAEQIAFTGRNAKIQKTAGMLPNGVSLTRTDGTLSGIPTQEGIFTFSVTVTNGAGTATANYEIRVHDVPVIHVTNLTRAIVGQAYMDSVQFSGLDAEATILRGTLPAGMTLNTDGTFAGAPTETGAFRFVVKVSNPAGSVQHRYRMVSVDVPAFQTAVLNQGIVGMAYSQQLVADGFDVRFVVPRASSLPTGLTLERSGLLHGTPTAAGDFTFDVRARNAAGMTVQTFTLTVTQPAATLSTANVIRGNSVTVSGSGYLPGDTLELWLHSTPVLLGTVTATNGTFTSTVMIPANTPAGAHHLVVTGAQSGTQSVPLTVANPPAAPAAPQRPQATSQSQLTATPGEETTVADESDESDESDDTEVEENEAEEDLPTLNKPEAEGETTAVTPVNWTGLLVAAFALVLAALALWFILWRRRRATES